MCLVDLPVDGVVCLTRINRLKFVKVIGNQVMGQLLTVTLIFTGTLVIKVICVGKSDAHTILTRDSFGRGGVPKMRYGVDSDASDASNNRIQCVPESDSGLSLDGFQVS